MKFLYRQEVKFFVIFLILTAWMCGCTAAQEEFREPPSSSINTEQPLPVLQEESTSLLTCSIGDPVYGGGNYLDGITIWSLQIQCMDEQ